MILVFNASPLIVLSKAGLMDVIAPLAARILIPDPVAGEIVSGDDPPDAAKLWISRHASLMERPPPIRPFVAAWDLGAGESSVIALTENLPGATAVLDDLAARRCAQALGLPLIGTLGLILMAKRKGIIPAVRPALDAIVAAGLFISRTHPEAILTQAGETEPPLS